MPRPPRSLWRRWPPRYMGDVTLEDWVGPDHDNEMTVGGVQLLAEGPQVVFAQRPFGAGCEVREQVTAAMPELSGQPSRGKPRIQCPVGGRACGAQQHERGGPAPGRRRPGHDGDALPPEPVQCCSEGAVGLPSSVRLRVGRLRAGVGPIIRRVHEVPCECLNFVDGNLAGLLLAVAAEVVLNLATAEDDVAGHVAAAHSVLITADERATEVGRAAEEDSRAVPVQVLPGVPSVFGAGVGLHIAVDGLRVSGVGGA